jgi:hypothetical protein
MLATAVPAEHRTVLRNISWETYQRILTENMNVAEGRSYTEIEESHVLPPITAAQATIFVDRFPSEKTAEWQRAVQDWIRTQATSDNQPRP